MVIRNALAPLARRRLDGSPLITDGALRSNAEPRLPKDPKMATVDSRCPRARRAPGADRQGGHRAS